MSGERIEIELPLFTPVPADAETFLKAKNVAAKAFRKESVEVENVLLASELQPQTSTQGFCMSSKSQKRRTSAK